MARKTNGNGNGHASAISPELRDEYTRKLEELLDERDDLEETRQSVSRTLKGELNVLGGQIAHVRRVLKGKDIPQRELPGMDLGERRRDSGVDAVLAAARRVRDEAERGGHA